MVRSSDEKPVRDLGDQALHVADWDFLGLSRRRFLQLAAIGVAGLALSDCDDEGREVIRQILDLIIKRPVRRDINTLATDDPILEAFRTAVTQMKALPTSDARNWTRQARIHEDFCPHQNWLTLPWHRAYLYYFEEICRELSGNEDFALPYWNWQKDRRVPSVFWGGTQNPLFNDTRQVTDATDANESFVGPSAIEGILNQTNFLLFGSAQITLADGQRTLAGQSTFESGPHNYIHGFIGGDMGFISRSPLDPVFWCHHGMIECIWVEWNMKRGNPNTNHNDWINRSFSEFVDRKGNPVQVTVADTLLHPLLLYRYDDPVLGVP